MATHWTYDASQFNNTDVGYYTGSTVGSRYRIRMYLQDTNSARQLLQDEEIDWQQTQEMNEYTAAASLCDILVAKAGGIKAKKISDFSIQYDPMFYRSLGAQLRARGQGYQVPYAGGISQTDKEALQGDTDWVQPSVVRGLDNNPAAPSPASPANGGSGTGGNPLTSL